MKHYTGSDLSEDFRSFYTKETNRIKKVLKSLGCTNIQFSRQFNYFYGFFTSKSGQMYYINCSDVRFSGYNQLMYRTVKSYDDFCGGFNQYVKADRLKDIKLV